MLKNIKNTSGNVVASYTYDLNGVRYTKTADGVMTTYFYNGNTLLGENKSNGTRLRYFYDASGLCGFSYFNGSETKFYTYVKDVLGNIVMIKDDMGVPLVRYTYNEWGVCFVEAFNLNNNAAAELALGNLNPFRYRGYYYDTESGLYYLMSRYYDPQIGRFISPDTQDYLKPETIGGVDLYAYCNNNPVMYVDFQGNKKVPTLSSNYYKRNYKVDIIKKYDFINLNNENVFFQKIKGGPYVDPDAQGWGENGEFTAYQKVMAFLATFSAGVGLAGVILGLAVPAAAPIGVGMFGIGFALSILFLALGGLGGAT